MDLRYAPVLSDERIASFELDAPARRGLLALLNFGVFSVHGGLIFAGIMP